jgi:hypothetical protein
MTAVSTVHCGGSGGESGELRRVNATVGKARGGSSTERALDWLLDSGATHRLLNDEAPLMRARSCTTMVTLGHGFKMRARAYARCR